MTASGFRNRRWLRPLALLALAMVLAVGEPLVLLIVTFGILTFLTPGGRLGLLIVSALAFALVFSGGPHEGMWYLDRGWAIVVGGWFAAVTLAEPRTPFFPRALVALGGAIISVGVLLLLFDGWLVVSTLTHERIQMGVEAVVELVDEVMTGDVDSGVAQAVMQAARVQGVIFPALLALSSLATLAVAWWLHVRLATGSDVGLAPLREFRFPDPLIWVLIVGLGLVMGAEWTVGLGRLGTNLVAFMGALYILRGIGVLLFLLGGVSILGGIVVLLGMLIAGPVLLAGAMVVGVGDSWLDLRSRVRGGAGGKS